MDELTSSTSSSAIELRSSEDTTGPPSPTYVAPLPESGAKQRTGLHKEMVKFSDLLQMPSSELRRKRELIQILTDLSWSLFKKDYKHLSVHPFGGFTNGLATRNSDLDIVLTGMFEPDAPSGGYSDRVKHQVVRCLKLLMSKLSLPLKKKQLIAQARIPILKLRTEDGIDLDIGIGNRAGPEAGSFIQKYVRELPPMRPLVLTAKHILKAMNLNDVSIQGLGSYSIANMAIAYIVDQRDRGEDIRDYGLLLLRFLEFYGREFDIGTEAVSLRLGTFCSKAEVSQDVGRLRLCIIDYFTGNDISGGTSKIVEIQALFRSVARNLRKYQSKPPHASSDEMFPQLTKWIDTRFISKTKTEVIDLSESDPDIHIKEPSQKKKTDKKRLATEHRGAMTSSVKRPRGSSSSGWSGRGQRAKTSSTVDSREEKGTTPKSMSAITATILFPSIWRRN